VDAGAQPTPRLDAIVRNLDRAQADDLLSRGLDHGCRLREAGPGRYELPVIASEQQLEELRRAGFELELRPAPDRSLYPVGEGDRFAAEDAVPRGFGRKLAERERQDEPA
jgi:hypothetical protein